MTPTGDDSNSSTSPSARRRGVLIGVGALVFFGSYLFGVVTAGMNAASYNEGLRMQLGLPVALAPTPDGEGALLQTRAIF